MVPADRFGPGGRYMELDAKSAPVADANAANARGNYIFAVALWVLAALTVWYFQVPFVFNVNADDFSPLIVLAALLALAGLYYGLLGVRDTLRVGKFGSTTLEADPALLGQTFSGRLRCSRDLAVRGDYQVELKCIEEQEIAMGLGTGHGGENIHHKAVVVWQDKQVVSASGVRSRDGIPFSFHLPADARPSPPRLGPGESETSAMLSTVGLRTPSLLAGIDDELNTVAGNVKWMLTVTAPMRGVDYYAVFPLYVRRPKPVQGGA